MFAENVKVRAQHCSKWVDGQIVKTNRDGTYTVVLDSDKKRIVLPRANIRYHEAACNPFQATMDKKGRISMCVSVPVCLCVRVCL